MTDEFCSELRDNYDEYHLHPIRVQGMLVSEDRFGNTSIRHPKFMGLRDDIDVDYYVNGWDSHFYVNGEEIN